VPLFMVATLPLSDLFIVATLQLSDLFIVATLQLSDLSSILLVIPLMPTMVPMDLSTVN